MRRAVLACLLTHAGCVCGFHVRAEGVTDGECSDGVDNDRSGRIDCDDPACAQQCASPDADTDTDTDTETETETGSDADADTDTGSETETETRTDTDTGSDTDTEQPTCDEQYGDVADYAACIEDAEICEFHISTKLLDSCTDLCRDRGGECILVWDESRLCEHGGSEWGCDLVFDTRICRCTRGCGLGPACPAGEDCTAGICID